MAEAPQASLHESLLSAAPAPSGPRAASRWAYGLWGMVLASLFVAYHASILLVWCTPRNGLAAKFHGSFLKQLEASKYFRGTDNSQSWAMFAPNPVRANNFVFVYVEDLDGEVWDFEQDIWGEDRYPYLWYDRRGKINRRIDGKKRYQRIYGAWVCREWERTHAGEPAKSVTFVRRRTAIPRPKQIFAQGGWNQWQAPYQDTEQETITCKTVEQGQLSNELRARYGLAPIAEDEVFRPVRLRSWWDRRQAEIEREERMAKYKAELEVSSRKRQGVGEDESEREADDEM